MEIIQNLIFKKHKEIKYYQWVAFALLVQAIFFYLPHVVWKTLSVRSGLNISDLVINEINEIKSN
jgi:hypothetical protein